MVADSQALSIPDVLESYPFPAFVLLCPHSQVSSPALSQAGTLPSPPQTPSTSSFPTSLYANQRWRRVTNGALLHECLSPDSQNELLRWLRDRISAPVASPELDTLSDDDSEDEDVDERHDGSARKAMSLEFHFPRRTRARRLELVASVLPSASSSSTGTTVMITTRPRSWRRSRPSHRTDASRPGTRRSSPVSGMRNMSHQSLPVFKDSFSKNVSPLLPSEVDGASVTASGRRRLPSKNLESINYGGGRYDVSINYKRGDNIFIGADGVVKTSPKDSYSGRPPNTAALFETVRWGETPLGPRESWTAQQRAFVQFLVHSTPLPAACYWGTGDDCTMLYNKAFAQECPDHPRRFAAHGPDMVQEELREPLGDLFDAVLAGSIVVKDDELSVRRDMDGHLREVYRRLFWAPVEDDDGTVMGTWHVTRDTTPTVVGNRRVGMLRDLGDCLSTVRTEHAFQSGVLETLHVHPKDVPFALLYYVEESVPTLRDPTRYPKSARLRLAGGIGVPDEHDSAPEVVSVSLVDDETPVPGALVAEDPTGSPANSYASTFDSVASADPGWGFANALLSRNTATVDCAELIDGYPFRVWDCLPSQAFVIPISLASDEGLPPAVLVMGVSPRIKLDPTYNLFAEDLRFVMASHLSAIRSYAAAERRLVDLAKLDRTKSSMFSSVSHELLAPLALISGPVDDVLADTPPEDKQKHELLTMAQRHIGRLSRLVSMLMNISALDAGRLQSSFVRVNLGMLTRNVAGLFRKIAANSKLQYTVLCDEKPRSVYVDREGWEKILCCLIENALKFTTEGFIRICLEYTHKAAILTVTCSAVGIPGTHVEDTTVGLFPPEGYQGRRRGSANGAGESAISLILAEKLVHLHHGELEMEGRTLHETLDSGTIFRVRLPLGSSHLSPDVIGSSDEPLVAPSAGGGQFGRQVMEEVATWYSDYGTAHEDGDTNSSYTSPPSASGSGESKQSGSSGVRSIDSQGLHFVKDDVIMVVEDLADAQRYMKTIFEPYCTVVVAKSAKEALAISEKQALSLIISDVMLPGMNGVALLDALRTGTKAQQLVPVILLTAIDDRRTTDMLRADDYLAKPFNARELVVRANMQLQMGKKRLALENAFEKRTQELRMLSEHSPAGMFRADEGGRQLYANQAWYDLCGVPRGDHWGDYIHPDTQEKCGNEWMDFLASDDRVRNIETKWLNGQWTCTCLAKLDPAGGQAGGMIGSCIDITESKLNDELQAQRIQEAEKRRAEAEEARQQQELLIDITSHEIRNPISSLMQCSSMVRNNLLLLHEQIKQCLETPEGTIKPTHQLLYSMEEDLDALDSIYQCGLAQERISNDVLCLGKMQLDRLEMFDVDTDIRKLAQKVLSIFQSEARMNHISLALTLSPAIEDLGMETVMTDPVRLTQIVTNLLSNAIRFTANSKERRVELRIDAGVDAPDEDCCVKPPSSGPHVGPDPFVYLFVSVRDTGPGLTPAELETLFERFTQASPMTHTVFGGSGLGLFVCRKLAERMGGRIDVSSAYGKGSEFRFFVRTRAKVSPSQQPVEHATAKESKSGTTLSNNDPWPVSVPQTTVGGTVRKALPRLSFSGERTLPKLPNVLVVEDNLINRKVLLRQLTHVGIKSDSASDGLEACTKIQQVMDTASATEGYDCVLMDLEMPVMDGYTAARKIRAEEAAGRLRRSIIIALTGNARKARISEGMLDFDAAVIKPYRLDDLLRLMEKLIQRTKANGSVVAGTATDTDAADDVGGDAVSTVV